MKTVYLSMKATKAAFFCTLFLLCSLAIFAEPTVRGFNYQAIARDASGNPVVNKNITIQLSIRKDNDNGLIVWQESHTTSTNDYGLFTLVIGQGTNTGAGTLSSMSMVNWAAANYYVQVWADFGDGLTDMGSTQLQSVPYAITADSALAGPKYPLSTLPDVNVTGLAPNMMLMWNGTQWVATNAATTIENGITAKIQNDSAYLTGLIHTETMNRINGDNNIASTITNDSAVLTTMINNGRTALTTFETLPNGQMYVGNTNNMATPVTMTGDATLTNVGMMTITNNAVTTPKILDGSITNSKIMAGVDATKIADGSVTNTDFENMSGTKGNLQSQITTNANNIVNNTASINTIMNLPGGEIYVGNTGNIATQVSISGDATLSSTGALTIANGAITNNKIAAGIDATKIANGTVTNTQFQYLQGASSNIQSQINTFGAITINNEDSIRAMQNTLSANTANIAMNTSNIAALQTGVQTLDILGANLQNQINANDAGIAANTTSITSLQNQVTTNTTNIATDESNITDLQTGVQTLYGRTASLQTQINTNDQGIAANTAAINTINSLPSGQMFVGNASNVTTPVTMSGDATMDNTGLLTIANGAVTNSKIAAGLDATKIADGSVTNLEFESLDGISSNIQSQINSNQADIASNFNSISANTAAIQTLTTDVNTNTADIATDETNITALQNQVTGIGVAMSTDETNITSLQTSVQTLNTKTTTLQNSVLTLNTEVIEGYAAINNLTTTVQNIIDTIDNMGVAIATNNANIQNQLNTIGVAMSTDETNITALQTLENTDATNITTIQSSLATVNTALTLLTSLPSGQMFVGNSSNNTTAVTMSGDVTMDNTGTTTIGTGVVTGNKIAGNTITMDKLSATGTPDSSKFLRGDGTWAAPAAGGGNATTFNGTTVYASQSVTTDSLNGTIVNSPTVNTTTLAATNANVTNANVTYANITNMTGGNIVTPGVFGNFGAVPLAQTILSNGLPINLALVPFGNVPGVSPVIAVIQNPGPTVVTVTNGMYSVGVVPAFTVCVYLKTGINTYTLIEQGELEF